MNKKSTTIKSVAQLIVEGMSKEIIINNFLEINKAVWGELVDDDVIWTKETLQLQFEMCPELQFCAIVDGKIIASVSCIYIDYNDALKCKNWKQISGERTFSTHNPNGDSMFGLDLSVPIEFQGTGVSKDLVEIPITRAVVNRNKKGVFLGARVPSFHKHSNKRTIEEHVFGKRNGGTMDPQIRFYQNEGFEPIQIVPGYIKDPESLDYGVLMFWKNELFEK